MTDNISRNEQYDFLSDTIEHQRKSKFSYYGSIFVGKKGFFAFLKYEILTGLFMECPGAAGIFLRGIFYKMLFKKLGKGAVIGKGVTIRNPNKISIGRNVVIDDHVMLDAKGHNNEGISIGDGVYLGRNTILSCKNGNIVLANRVNIGFNSEIVSLNRVEVGEDTLFAAYTYVVGGGHIAEDFDRPIREQREHAIGVKIGKNSWLGAKSVIMDGCDVGDNTIIGAGAIVTKSIPDFSVAVGIPAKVIRDRREEKKA